VHHTLLYWSTWMLSPDAEPLAYVRLTYVGEDAMRGEAYTGNWVLQAEMWAANQGTEMNYSI
jgi:hypothetical protein